MVVPLKMQTGFESKLGALVGQLRRVNRAYQVRGMEYKGGIRERNRTRLWEISEGSPSGAVSHRRLITYRGYQTLSLAQSYSEQVR